MTPAWAAGRWIESCQKLHDRYAPAHRRGCFEYPG
jgi:hypothetical protein